MLSPNEIILDSSNYIKEFIRLVDSSPMADELNSIELLEMIIGYIADNDESTNNISEMCNDLYELLSERYTDNEITTLTLAICYVAKQIISQLDLLGVFNITQNQIVWYKYKQLLQGYSLVLKKVTEYAE